MVNRFFLVALVAAAFSLVMPIGEAFAYTHVLDGNLSDWGVTPFTDWTPTSSDIDYVVENNYNRTYSDAFSEGYDLEAMYFDDDINNIYFAIVSSNPYNGGWAQESLFFDFSGRSYTDILASESNGYKYAADLCPAPLNILSTQNVYKVNQSTVYELNHYKSSPYHFPVSLELSPGGLSSHTLLGSYQVFNRDLGLIENPTGYYNTYVLEGSISKSYFGNECTQPIELYLAKVTCIKDWITLNGDKDNPCTPEPASMTLFGIGGLAMAFLRKRQK